jgi:hypothetical protein
VASKSTIPMIAIQTRPFEREATMITISQITAAAMSRSAMGTFLGFEGTARTLCGSISGNSGPVAAAGPVRLPGSASSSRDHWRGSSGDRVRGRPEKSGSEQIRARVAV